MFLCKSDTCLPKNVWIICSWLTVIVSLKLTSCHHGFVVSSGIRCWELRALLKRSPPAGRRAWRKTWRRGYPRSVMKRCLLVRWVAPGPDPDLFFDQPQVWFLCRPAMKIKCCCAAWSRPQQLWGRVTTTWRPVSMKRFTGPSRRPARCNVNNSPVYFPKTLSLTIHKL